ncbi:hypothetical protein [Acidocella sp.]|uniref:hypothetical protein n=1 Tax=Acidocella sp. TaxID=50710 RepID=UPI002621F782|nr:hypothetical protein [Acidocella sp.]
MADAYRRGKEWLALTICQLVGTMECAAVFTGLALVSLPAAIHGGVATLIAWTAQTFLQLVLLSVIMVGQDIQQRKHDESRALLEELHEMHREIHQILTADSA